MACLQSSNTFKKNNKKKKINVQYIFSSGFIHSSKPVFTHICHLLCVNFGLQTQSFNPKLGSACWVILQGYFLFLTSWWGKPHGQRQMNRASTCIKTHFIFILIHTDGLPPTATVQVIARQTVCGDCPTLNPAYLQGSITANVTAAGV